MRGKSRFFPDRFEFTLSESEKRPTRRAWNARPANPSSLRTMQRPAASASFLGLSVARIRQASSFIIVASTALLVRAGLVA